MNEEHFDELEREVEQQEFRRSRSSHSHEQRESNMPLIYLTLIAFAIIGFMIYVVHGELSSRNVNNQAESEKTEQVSVSQSETSSTERIEESAVEESSEEVNSDEKVVLSGSGREGKLTINDASQYVTAQFILNDDSKTAWFSMTNTEVSSSGIDLSSSMEGYEVYVNSTSDSSEIKLTNAKNLILYIDGELIDLSKFDKEKEVTISVTFNRETSSSLYEDESETTLSSVNRGGRSSAYDVEEYDYDYDYGYEN